MTRRERTSGNVPRRRKFGNKWYSLEGVSGKAHCNIVADRLRKEGKLARVVPSGHGQGWSVYSRSK